jgi:fused signal recognition particle receptor
MAKMGFAERLKRLLGLGVRNEEFFEDLVDGLIEGDLGSGTAMRVGDELRERCARKGISEPSSVRAELKDILAGMGKECVLEPADAGLNFFLVLGVNGVGKTSSIAKLADYFSRTRGLGDTILAAGDTFRAAAIDQLRIHGERLGLRVVGQAQGSDSGAVMYDAIEAAKASGSRLVLADTAGRLHNKVNLVKELEKIDKIIAGRVSAGLYKKLLVIDATTGQNGLRQAEVFNEAVGIDGVVLTKYDSSAKGGIAIAVAKEFGIPTAYVCNGEKYGDIARFSLSVYLDEFLGIG